MDPGTGLYENSCGSETEVDDILSLQLYKDCERKLNTELKLVGITYGNSKNPRKANKILTDFIEDIKTVVGATSSDSENTELSQKLKEITEKEKINLIITGPTTDLRGLQEKNYRNIDKIISSFPVADDYHFGNFLFDKVLPLIGWRFDQWNLNLDPCSVKELLKKAEGKTYFFTIKIATALTNDDIGKVKNKKIQELMKIKYPNHYRRFGQKGYFPWDAYALAILVDLETNQGMFKYRKEKLKVKRSGLCYKLEPSEKGYEAIVAYDIDKSKFKEFIIDGLK